MHVDDVPGAVAFFTDILGFKAWINTPGYAYVQREVAAISDPEGLAGGGRAGAAGESAVHVLH